VLAQRVGDCGLGLSTRMVAADQHDQDIEGPALRPR
jgi:hypothetical protein